MILGRTNLECRGPWLRPVAGPDPASLANAIHGSGVEAVDISTQPALWGGLLRAYRGWFLSCSSYDLERATTDRHAADLIEAHLIETLSAAGRPCIDFYCLRIRYRLQEFQLAGALEALESAREEGMVRFVGLAAEGPAAMSAWQLHDAFEILLAEGEHLKALQPMARERRVGIIGGQDLRLIRVSSVQELEIAFQPQVAHR